MPSDLHKRLRASVDALLALAARPTRSNLRRSVAAVLKLAAAMEAPAN